MKTLDVKSLVSGIDGSIQTIDNHQEQVNTVAADLKAFLSIGDSFSGKGAEAIKAFYEECHVPFLIYYDQLLLKFRRALNGIKDAYPAVEPEESGFVSQEFMENELKTELNTFKNMTINRTDSVNDISSKVSDIVSLPKIDDNDVVKGIKYAQKKITNTIDDLEEFDSNQTKEIKEIDEDITLLMNYVNEIASLFKSGKITLNTSNFNKFKETDSFEKLQIAMKKIDWANIPVSSKPSILLDAYAPVSSIGNTFGTMSEGVALTQTAYLVKRHNVSISKESWGYRVKNGRYIGIKGNNYHNAYINSQLKLGNTPEIATHVKPSAAIKSAFTSKIGLAGIAITAGENAYNNIKSNESNSKIVGDVVVDVGVGAVSLAAGAAVVSAVTMAGAPILAAVAAGFMLSTAIAYVSEGVKVGKDEKTLSDSLKAGAEKGINTVAGWFK